MITIISALGALIIGVLITLVVCHFLPKEKIRTANQELEKKENETQLRIKDLEKEYIEKLKDLEKEYTEKRNELENQYNELNEQYYQDIQKQDKELHDSATRQLNEMEQARRDWEKEKNEKLLNWSQRESDLKVEVQKLEERRNNIIQTLETEAKESGEIFKTQQIQIAQEQIDKAKTELLTEYEKAKEDAKQTYLETLADMVSDITAEYGIKSKELEEVLIKLSDAQAKAEAAIESNKRAELDRQQKDFYRLQIPEVDLEEIKRLRSVEPYLRDKEPLNKVIYKCYYEKPYTDLIGRVFGARKPMGIYKITNLENGKCYVGQAVNVPERWRQHIKRGVGAEPVTQNKLYPAMKEIGVENFMFELLEECKANELTAREKYWTDFYEAQTYGYTVKKG